ncbi:MAG: helix-turn-helix transcriptional regulator [Candidatus Cloacimonetes bacterium]|jgi:transcriptional regulator with XRE-family HTH domain|nr:helix-turn-helix domain-containing protein [Candidatus Cloacimonadota bacterium]MDD4156955.1 helix-turn-helix transcriptional regulator [Candidatus Cloacimonadota bacterium]
MKRNLGKRIKLKRVSLNLKQSELAKITGFSQNFISLVEREQRHSYTSVDKIYNALKDYEIQLKKAR